MGQYTITIKGLGAHHNKDNKGDAEKMAFQFVHDLKEAGHNISEATFVKTDPYFDNLLTMGGSLTYNVKPKKGGKITTLTLKQIREIELDKSYYGDKNYKAKWTIDNFVNLLETAKILHLKLAKLKRK